MSESGGAGGTACDQILPGRAANAITPNATSERDEVARVRNTELKRGTWLSTVASRSQDFVDSSLDVIQRESHWAELNCLQINQIGLQRPGLSEGCAGRGDLSRLELVTQTGYRQFRLSAQSTVRDALDENISGVMKFGREHGQVGNRLLWLGCAAERSRPGRFPAARHRDKKSDANCRRNTGPRAKFFCASPL